MICGLLPSPKRPDPRSMATPRWSLQRGWHELGAQVVVISSLGVMTGCYHLVRINVVCYDRAPIPILGLDAAAGHYDNYAPIPKPIPRRLLLALSREARGAT